MAEGLRIIPGDNSPAIELTAGGARCPSFLTRKQVIYDDHGNVNFAHGAKPVAGSQLFVTLENNIDIFPDSISLLPNIVAVTALSANATNITGKVLTNLRGKRNYIGYCNLYQVLPAQTQGFDGKDGKRYGISLQNSTNFFEITDAATVGQVIYKNRVNLNSTWEVPVVTGYPDRTKYIVFAQWNRADRFIDYDASTHKITAMRHPGGKTGHAVNADCAINVVIFCNGAAPTPHNGGVTIRNAKGECTFSTAKTPFLMKQWVNIPAGRGSRSPYGINTSIAKPMVPLGRTGIYIEAPDGMGSNKWIYYSYACLAMAGNRVQQGIGSKVYQQTAQYGDPLGANSEGQTYFNFGMQFPVLDATNYFQPNEIL
ncbi:MULTISPECIES: DUF6453 family protein [Enterobacter cloacae complex]|uniref:DUF6453 family protein n=1 Tax=Enterobacter cloacae complex TaxID=354276 RepID=UPI0013D4C4CA|nr:MULTISPECIES: DUF6453 family protein [Enterobacter cloacae complex]MBG0579342.1 hypothetical protein [Enterobacter kobei]